MIFKMHLQQNLSAYLSVPHELFIYQLNWQINIIIAQQEPASPSRVH